MFNAGRTRVGAKTRFQAGVMVGRRDHTGRWAAAMKARHVLLNTVLEGY